MKQEDKELLLKDLCARLPYGVIVHHDDYFDKDYPRPNEVLTTHHLSQYEKELERWNIKPYLRPMSSMTEEEDNEWRTTWLDALFESANNEYPKSESFIALSHSESIDWLNANHFDYRGLIEKGLALEAPEGMYKKGE